MLYSSFNVDVSIIGFWNEIWVFLGLLFGPKWLCGGVCNMVMLVLLVMWKGFCFSLCMFMLCHTNFGFFQCFFFQFFEVASIWTLVDWFNNKWQHVFRTLFGFASIYLMWPRWLNRLCQIWVILWQFLASQKKHLKKHIGGFDITIMQSLQVGHLCHYQELHVLQWFFQHQQLLLVVKYILELILKAINAYDFYCIDDYVIKLSKGCFTGVLGDTIKSRS